MKIDELYKELETAQDIIAEYTEKELILAEIKGFIEGQDDKETEYREERKNENDRRNS